MRQDRSRRGTLLVVVLGLITIFLALMLAITVRVYNSTKTGTSVQQSAQAYIMLQAAKMIIDAGNRSSPLVTIPLPVTAGDQSDLSSPAGANKPFGDILGWCRIAKDAAATSPPVFWIVAAGGSSAFGTAKVNITDGDPLRNSYEVRYYYKATYDPAKAGTDADPRFTIDLQPVVANAGYQWN